jgi:hypothetical protein
MIVLKGSMEGTEFGQMMAIYAPSHLWEEFLTPFQAIALADQIDTPRGA